MSGFGPLPGGVDELEVREIVNTQRPVMVWAGGPPANASDSDNWMEWHGLINTGSGTITFNVTTDGTAGGPPVFANLNNCIPQVTAIRDTDENNESPWAHIRRYEDGRRVVVQVKRSNQGGILLGGAYYGNLNNSNAVTVCLTLKGIRA